ncbi:MAG: hypothetical protein WBG67_16335, partial [Thermoanaerobaculia bacterium]
MIEAAQLLKIYVQGLRHLSGAGSASLFVPAMITGASSPLLVHDGDLAPVPELVDLETAAQLGSPGATATDDNESGAERDSAPFFSSAAPDGVLIPLPSAVGPWSPSGPSASESPLPAGPP